MQKYMVCFRCNIEESLSCGEFYPGEDIGYGFYHLEADDSKNAAKQFLNYFVSCEIKGNCKNIIAKKIVKRILQGENEEVPEWLTMPIEQIFELEKNYKIENYHRRIRQDDEAKLDYVLSGVDLKAIADEIPNDEVNKLFVWLWFNDVAVVPLTDMLQET